MITNKKERLMQLETRIEVLERELRNLKEEIEKLKIDETFDIESVTTPETKTNTEFREVFAIPIDKFGFSDKCTNCLILAGITTLEDLAVLSEEELLHKVKFLGMDPSQEVIEKIGHLPLDVGLFQKRMIEKEEFKEVGLQLALKLSKKFALVLETYARIEEKAKNEGLKECFKWSHLKSMFHSQFRRYRKGKSHTLAKEKIDNEFNMQRPLLNVNYCFECMNGRHPRMAELLTAEHISMKMIKEAVLEDVRESNTGMKPGTTVYSYYSTFIEIIKNYE